MLTLTEKILFVSLALISGAWSFVGFQRMTEVIHRGEGEFNFGQLPRKAFEALFKTLSQKTVLNARLGTSLFHALVAWAFLYYFLVNAGDLLEGFLPGFRFLGTGLVGGLYRLGADLLSAAALVGVLYFLLRRFLADAPALQIREGILLHPQARKGMRRDSLIVILFIFLHVGARFLGASFRIAAEGPDPWQPLAGAVAGLWAEAGPGALAVGEHAAFWLALGLILAFLPYFPYSKHLHLMAAPVNFLTRPERRSLGEMRAMELEFNAEKFGPSHLEELEKPLLLDSFACIMCSRCQQVCPAYEAGTILSPAALEINKRYEIKVQMKALAEGEPSRTPLTESVLLEEAVRACTTCAACVEICPVGNEPLQDILEMRRYLTLTEVSMPTDQSNTLRSIERRGNPWGFSPADRTRWTEDLDQPVPVMAEKKSADVLFWVGCSGSYDPRNQKITQSITRLLQRAGVDFAILGQEESCNGDPARRMGEEFSFQMAVEANAEILASYEFETVITGCPHCFNVFKNEYADFGVDLKVLHHSQYLAQLVDNGKLKPRKDLNQIITYHDSCYLGRYNEEYDAPREILRGIPGVEVREMPRSRARGLCCGGGGGGVFYDVPHEKDIPEIRLEEAEGVDPDVVASACPFCLTMFEGAERKETADVLTKDIAELLDESM
ncbi:MAG: heterodisulfide reductase-related iron-sulfur binding cluster [Anaerolineales bacterium]|nr:heterodisulfide reductase-related iron-sulfur binding cluster [Anaerolineales bacterium]